MLVSLSPQFDRLGDIGESRCADVVRLGDVLNRRHRHLEGSREE
jgi:hypothetical protein